MSFNPQWIKPTDKVLTAAEVKKLPVGTKVTVIGSDRHGEMTKGEYKVLQNGKKKVLRAECSYYYDAPMEIRDYPNKRYLAIEQVYTL